MKCRTLKCGKYTNFIMAMNAFLLAPILGCVSEIVRGKMSRAICHSLRTKNKSESCHVVLSYVSQVGKVKNEKVSK